MVYINVLTTGHYNDFDIMIFFSFTKGKNHLPLEFDKEV